MSSQVCLFGTTLELDFVAADQRLHMTFPTSSAHLQVSVIALGFLSVTLPSPGEHATQLELSIFLSKRNLNCRILTEETTLVSDLEIVRTARMPLLKAKLSGGIDLKVTLSPLDVKDIPACQTAELVSKTFKELPHARKLLLILKALMRPPNCLNAMVGVHTGGVSSYTITLMVLAFCKFQVRFVLYPIHLCGGPVPVKEIPHALLQFCFNL